MRPYRFTFLLSLLAAWLLVSPLSAQTITGGLPGALIDIENGNYLLAIPKLEKIREEGSKKDQSQVFYYLGLAQFKYGVGLRRDGVTDQADQYFANAKKNFTEAVARDKKNAYAHSGMGRSLAAEGNYDAAKAEWNQAAELGTSDVPLLVALSGAYLYAYDSPKTPKDKRNDAIDQATNLLTRAQTLDADNAQIMVGLGDVYMARGVRNAAINNYREAIANDPGNFVARYKLGKLLIEDAQYQEGLEQLTEAKATNPEYAPVYEEMADLYAKAKQLDKALEAAQEYLSLLKKQGADITYAESKYFKLLYQVGKYPEAVQVYEEYLKDTSSFILSRVYAYCLTETEQYDAALAAMGSFFTMTKEEQRIAKDYYFRGVAKAGSGNCAAAEEDIVYAQNGDNFTELTQLSEADVAGAYEALIDCYKASENWAKAVQFYVTSHNQTGSVNDLYYAAVNAYSKMKDYRLADSLFQKLLTLRETLIPGYYYRGMSLNYLDIQLQDQEQPDSSAYGKAEAPFLELERRVLEAGEVAKYKSQLTAGLAYLAIYYYQNSRDLDAYTYILKLEALDPENTYVEQLKEPLKNKLEAEGETLPTLDSIKSEMGL